SFGTVSSLKYYVDENHKIEVPYTVTYISSNEEEIKKVDKVIENSSHNVELKNNANFLYVPDSEVVVVNLSTFKDILIDLKVENREKIISKFKLLRNEAGYIERPGVMMSILEKNDIHIGNQKYNIKVNTKVP